MQYLKYTCAFTRFFFYLPLAAILFTIYIYIYILYIFFLPESCCCCCCCCSASEGDMDEKKVDRSPKKKGSPSLNGPGIVNSPSHRLPILHGAVTSSASGADGPTCHRVTLKSSAESFTLGGKVPQPVLLWRPPFSSPNALRLRLPPLLRLPVPSRGANRPDAVENSRILRRRRAGREDEDAH